VLDRSSSLQLQIDAFLQDVHDALNDPSRSADRKLCLERMQILDERRPCLDSLQL
jgi:flagellar hook-associated protein FlgK